MFLSNFLSNLTLSRGNAFIWDSKIKNLKIITHFRFIDLDLLIGIERQKKTIYDNTINFAEGNFTNNALLWGSRGNGKSSLIKSVFNEINKKNKNLKLIQLNKNNIFDIEIIYEKYANLKNYNFIIFIDDLSFEKIDSDYKIIKSTLDGSIQNQPKNIVLYVTSNRRHLMPRDMIENERSSAIHTDESVEEKISLSDRFGLWIGFHNLSQDDFISLLQYAKAKNITIIPQLSFPSHARASIVSMDVRRNRLIALGDDEGAEMYALSDPNDNSVYQSAQLYNDNTINICMESSYRFFDKVVAEVAAMYQKANVRLKQFSIGADELPYGVWEGSPRCINFATGTANDVDLESLYNDALLRLKSSIEKHGAVMSGWEDFLLVHSKNSQSETKLKDERFDYNVIPYSWNNTWGGGREDMVYKLANAGFKTVMSNSSAFYFDMANDNDMDAFGLNWSGYVDYFDTWAIDPQDIFANRALNRKHNITSDYILKTTKLKPNKQDNLIGIQSQLWTETVTSETILDQMLLPNLIVFAERAWAKKPYWISDQSSAQEHKMTKYWNQFLNVMGKRTLPVINNLFPDFYHDLPKPGGIIKNDSLFVRSPFPGMRVHYTLDGSTPSPSSKAYHHPISVNPDNVVVLRSFDNQLKGGKSITVLRE